MNRLILTITALTLLLLSPQAAAQSLDCFEGMKTTRGGDVSALLRERPSLIVFWSTHCGPCLADLPPMNTHAGRMPGLNFIWVSAETDARLERLADTLTNIHYVVDRDSVSWRLFDPGLWGVGFAFDRKGGALWHGYAAELSESMLTQISAETRTEKKPHRFGLEYRVTNGVDYKDSQISVGNSDDSEEWELQNKYFTSILGVLVQGGYGGRTEIVYLHPEHASAFVNMKLRIRYGTLPKQEARQRALKMLCAAYDIGLEVGEPREDGTHKVVLDLERFVL